MNRFVLIGCWILLLAATSWAENVYVSENIRLTVRKEPGNDKKIVSILVSGDQVNVLQFGDEWTKIRLSDDKEGWVLSRFLSTQMPSSVALKVLEKKYTDLVAQTGTPQEDFRRLKEENEKLAAEQQNCSKQLQSLNDNYQTLKMDSQDVVKLRAEYDDALARVAEQGKKLEVIEAEIGKATFDQNFKWFLAGGGVLLAGFLIGFITRRKRSYSLIR
ncbi:MAG: TIGR04211 family SH3 domain-containing protein [Deltaproteobacteria bacterium]|nr:TIGR04211 family SH3 domain-containing protein [Deltaproteobacteria bacterium]